MKDAAVSDCATHDIKIICPDGMAGRIGVEEALPVRAESRAIAGKHAPRHLRDCAIRIKAIERRILGCFRHVDAACPETADRKSVVAGKSVSVSGDLGGARTI